MPRANEIGYWGPPTSSVDWCENNYAHSSFVCEWFNTLSSFVIVLVALVGLGLHWRVLERRFALAFATLALVGLGSAAFHATLLFGLQMADELPMLYLALVMVFILINLDAGRPSALARMRWTGLALAAHGVLVTLLCTLTRGPLQFITFHLSFGSLESYCLYRTFRLYRTSSLPVARNLFRWGMTCYVSAIGVWFIDLRFCTALNAGLANVGLPNPQLHALWHVLVSFGFYALILQIAQERLDRLGRTPRLVQSAFGVPAIASST
ncbi:MAG TPA: ceramidase [Polyangiaceae bacterium]|jgi:dihydroceramidase|nr:ceramidase [Polyangiaceae bacterium]